MRISAGKYPDQRRKNKSMETLRDFWLFLRERKKFWLAPVVIVLLILGIIVAFGAGSALAPFIYSIF